MGVHWPTVAVLTGIFGVTLGLVLGLAMTEGDW